MKILFVLNTPGFLQHFDVTIDRLLERGHDVSLAFTRADLRPESLEIYEDRELCPRVVGEAPTRDDTFAPVATSIRAAVDFVRYLDPRFAKAEYLRNRRRLRAAQLAPWTRMFGMRRSAPAPLVALLVRLLLALERALPSAERIEAFLREHDPDVLVVSPLVNGASPQTDYVKSARVLSLPCAVCIASWDNLTNKGLIRELPDRVVVWNIDQKREAIELHGVPEARLIVTGAQPFDRWFGRQPRLDRREFCLRVGLPADRPYVLFVGSTSNIAEEGVEEQFVRDWIEAVRASAGDGLRGIGVLIRPHPHRKGAWGAFDLDGQARVSIWPPRRPNSVTPATRSDYFDSLYHSAAVVGINTSAMIEASIIGRPVLTVRASAFEQAQDGTLHFRYLLPEHGGFAIVGADLEEHVRQLTTAVTDPSTAADLNARFVHRFIRPKGIEQPANDLLVAAIEQLRVVGEPASARSLAAMLARRLLETWVWIAAQLAAFRDPALIATRLDSRTARVRKLAKAAGLARMLRILLERAADGHEQYARQRVASAKQRVKRQRKRERERLREYGELLLQPRPPEPREAHQR